MNDMVDGGVDVNVVDANGVGANGGVLQLFPHPPASSTPIHTPSGPQFPHLF